MMEIPGGMLAAEFRVILPSVTTWSRLEPHPATPDLAAGLAAGVADPLWLLHRQWAFGELTGEDAGSPVDVRLEGDHAVLGRYHPGPLRGTPASAAVDYDEAALPLEVAVEREPVRGTHPRLAAASGLLFTRLLAAEGATAMSPRFRAAFELDINPPADAASDRAGADWAALFTGRAIDGDTLATAVRPLVDTEGQVTGIPTQVTIPSGQRPAVKRALGRFMAAYDAWLTEPTGGEATAWRPDRQEYSFAAAARTAAGPVTLRADEYTDGCLDWWTFRASTDPDLGEPSPPSTPHVVPPMLPSPVRYPGMPADRLWEFEDARVNLGALDAGPTDLGRLLLVEYGLVYGTDWWVVPLQLPVGSLFTVTTLEVRDTFGTVTTIGPARDASGLPWEMFELGQTGKPATRIADLFFLAPTLPRRLEGDPVERVSLLRDEMANLAWGVEHVVPGVSGDPVERSLESARLPIHQELPQLEPDVQRIYRLMSPVPTNWIPFEPVATAAPTAPNYDLAFERRVLLRTLPGPPVTTEEVHPRGTLLRSDPTQTVDNEPPLRIAEEEIPRDGAAVTRAFQYTRWFDGRSYLWLGRAKHTGRGEGSSGLGYDAADRIS